MWVLAHDEDEVSGRFFSHGVIGLLLLLLMMLLHLLLNKIQRVHLLLLLPKTVGEERTARRRAAEPGRGLNAAGPLLSFTRLRRGPGVAG
jgi:hypothetical protein